MLTMVYKEIPTKMDYDWAYPSIYQLEIMNHHMQKQKRERERDMFIYIYIFLRYNQHVNLEIEFLDVAG